MKLQAATATCFLLLAGSIPAFPPNPYYTLHGLVRDQAGQTLKGEGASVLLLKDGVEVGRAPVTSQLLDQSYELNVRIDANRSGTTLYSEAALPAQGQFSLAVEMNGALYYPIEVAGNLTAGKGAERIRLDLNLGADTDRDGLPDIWEQWQLYQAGYSPDENGDWALDLIDKEGDLDKDGQSNFTEYVAGTFAGDATEVFKLEIREKLTDLVRFEFYSITGKTYTIESSADAQTWTRVPLAADSATAEPSTVYTATAVGVRSAFVTPAPGAAKEFYRLTVR